MTTDSSTVAPLPWFRQPWPWLLMLMPAIALVGGVWTFWIAYTTNHALVVDDYYKEGKAINLDIARDRRAVQRGMHATLRSDAQGVGLTLEANVGVPLPAAVQLRAMHATRAELDVSMQLMRGPDGAYRNAQARLPRTGRWRLQIDDASREWRLVATTDRLDEPVAFGTRP